MPLASVRRSQVKALLRNARPDGGCASRFGHKLKRQRDPQRYLVVGPDCPGCRASLAFAISAARGDAQQRSTATYRNWNSHHATLPLPRQRAQERHTAHRTSPGFKNEGIFYEEVISTQGFSRAYSIAYHLRPPDGVKHVEAAGTMAVEVVDVPVLRHHHLKSGGIPAKGDPITGRVPLLTNSDVTLWRCRPTLAQGELYRNALADEVIFIHKGSGRLLTQFGVLPVKPFDYVVIPRCTTYRFDFDAGAQPDLLVVESAGTVNVPSKYLNHDGQLRLGAPYYERDLHGPTDLFIIDEEKDTPVVIKDGSRLSRYVLASHPFDVIGWDGQVYPFTFNADDFEPITGTIHQPPPIHLTFETSGFVLCTFAPACSTHTRTR